MVTLAGRRQLRVDFSLEGAAGTTRGRRTSALLSEIRLNCFSLLSFDSANTLEQKKRATDTVSCLAHQKIHGFY